MEAELKRANEILWDVEEAVRGCEAAAVHRNSSRSRLVYTSNDLTG
jgi:hypothetical protein